ncbi:MAG: type 4a pilus biogenesis protein PilO [Armatimonadetes bacterium]|nr:type 4a pilus biogenesis protein PilO [Armatimonadota bacterium]MCA1997882.1 type 4a pilus biogenesis protein PilO [Armatimonadota bacterium]
MKRKAPNVKAIGITMVALTVAGLGLCAYQYSALSDVSAKAESLAKEVQEQASIAKRAEDTASRMERTAARLAHLELSVSQAAYIPTMLTELERTGQQSGLVVLGVRPIEAPKPTSKDSKDGKESPKKRKPYQELDIEVKGRGPYRAALNFLKALQSFPRIVAVRSLTLSPKSQAGASADVKPELDFTITIRTFVFPPEKPQEGRSVHSGAEARKDG